MVDNEIDLEKIRQRVERRMQLRAKFMRELSSFLTVNLVLWGIWFFSEGNSFSRGGFQIPWPMFVTFFWGISVVKRGVRIFYSDELESAYDREMQKEIRREKARVANSAYYGDPDDTEILEKAKRSDGTVRLSDDGELIYEDKPERKSSRQDL
jgi:hypothetical protein